MYSLPDHLSFEEGAAIPLAGLTAWRALVTLGEVRPENAKGKVVLVPGIGGGEICADKAGISHASYQICFDEGVALFALQFAVGMGAEVWVTSGGGRFSVDRQ